MADKIIVRKGLKANLPALDEAELGFCTDTKELYIGSNEGNILINRSGTTQLANPTNLNSTAKTENSVALAWTGVTGATSYDILVNSVLFQNITGTSINVTGLSSNTAYTFTVRAKNATQSSSGVGISVTTSTAQTGTAAIVTSGLTHYYNPKDGIKTGSVLNNLSPSGATLAMTVTGATANGDGSLYMDGTDALSINGTGTEYYNQSKPLTMELRFKSRTTTTPAASMILLSNIFLGSFSWSDFYAEGIYANEEYGTGAINPYNALKDTTNDIHFTITYTGSNVIIYRNGVAELNFPTAQPVSLVNANTPNIMLLSADAELTGFPSDFQLFRVYNRVLTDAEILQNYNAGKEINLTGGTTPTPETPTDPVDEGIVTTNLTVKTWVGGIE